MPNYLSALDLGDGVGRQLKDSAAVSTNASQGLTETQKANARTNIGVSANFTGTYTEWTQLNSNQKAVYKTVDFI